MEVTNHGYCSWGFPPFSLLASEQLALHENSKQLARLCPKVTKSTAVPKGGFCYLWTDTGSPLPSSLRSLC